MSWAGSLFGGSSPELNSLIGQFGQAGSNLLGQGQKYSNQAGDWFSNIVSGDATKQTQALAPEISAAKTSAGQDQKTNTMFNARSEGTAAKNASSQDKVHSDITNLLGSLTGSAANSLANLGTTETSTGLQALGAQQGAVQQRIQNWNDSIFGKGITTAVAAGEGYALGGFKAPSSNDDNSSNDSDDDSE